MQFRGQFLGGVIAQTSEVARHAAGLVCVDYEPGFHDAELRADKDDLYAPQQVNAGFPADTSRGAVELALTSAAMVVDQRRQAAPGAALVEADDAVPARVEQASSIGRAARSRAAVEHDRRGPSPVPEALPEDLLAVAHVEPAVVVRFDRGVHQR